MKNTQLICILFICFLCLSCHSQKQQDPVVKIVNEWRGKEIKIPDDLIFTRQGMDTVPFSVKDKKYKILCYIDSIGCTSCKLKIEEWKTFIANLDSSLHSTIGYLFFFHPRKIKDVRAELFATNFSIPVCIDTENRMSKLNSFPTEFEYQTFLLDNRNKVLAIGNPINNSAVKELYLDILLERSSIKKIRTEIEVSTNRIDMGNRKLSETVTLTLTIRNTGNNPFVITGIDTSCGCTTTHYTKKPVPMHEETTISILYKPKEPGMVKENIIIRGNIPEPVRINIEGKIG